MNDTCNSEYCSKQVSKRLCDMYYYSDPPDVQYVMYSETGVYI